MCNTYRTIYLIEVNTLAGEYDMTLHDKDYIEDMIDEHGLQHVIETISDVCYEKEQHIKENWQDIPLSATWNKAARYLFTCAMTTKIRDCSGDGRSEHLLK